ncbi:D-alanine--D-alanine ligase family protein [Microbacterium arabinogalactanolyticum]|uniref:D-alanine--D-alanine ligase n=1 Tax=Microbacterium arabinogalactanolyticum TaxID=69365 RepID=A0ABQ5NEF4_9MICO|nr:D-alanine--D-alanine ligase family protein [Microbacterium arabinogalactanolyticum]GLC84183.1 D-alanine--D-alanine ligase [Microbacterium arabinogalactanolyticum]
MTRVLVIGGGQSAEHEVSLAGASGVAAALRETGFIVDEITIGRDGCWCSGDAALGESPALSLRGALEAMARADVVFPVLHGMNGEDGSLAALCNLAGVPVVGSGVRAGAIGMDKWATKLVAEAVGIRTARGVLVGSADIGDVEFESPVVVKPVAAGSSHGVTLVTDAGELQDALWLASRFDDRILIEEVVRGREIDVSVLREAGGVRWATPPLEIHAAAADGSALFDTAAKYDGSARFTTPADLTRRERTALTAAAVRMFDALGCAGVARIDFFLTEDGPVLNEVNTMPGMTAHSQVPRMFQAAGVGYGELAGRLVAAALAAHSKSANARAGAEAAG